MRRAFLLSIVLACAAQVPAIAGVVIQMEVKDMGESPPRAEKHHMAVAGKLLRYDDGPVGGSNARHSMLYLGNRPTMLVVDHAAKSYFELDRETMQGLGEQMKQAMAEFERQLATMPADQRAMAEKLMKQQMGGGKASPPAAPELRRTAETSTLHGYPCVKYDVLREGSKVREVWVTDWSNVEGADELSSVVAEMVEYNRGIMESIRDWPGSMAAAPIEDSPFDEMKEVNGFPIVVREFENGSMIAETVIVSVEVRKIEPSAFEVPAGYTKQQMGRP